MKSKLSLIVTFLITLNPNYFATAGEREPAAANILKTVVTSFNPFRTDVKTYATLSLLNRSESDREFVSKYLKDNHISEFAELTYDKNKISFRTGDKLTTLEAVNIESHQFLVNSQIFVMDPNQSAEQLTLQLKKMMGHGHSTTRSFLLRILEKIAGEITGEIAEAQLPTLPHNSPDNDPSLYIQGFMVLNSMPTTEAGAMSFASESCGEFAQERMIPSRLMSSYQELPAPEKAGWPLKTDLFKQTTKSLDDSRTLVTTKIKDYQKNCSDVANRKNLVCQTDVWVMSCYQNSMSTFQAAMEKSTAFAVNDGSKERQAFDLAAQNTKDQLLAVAKIIALPTKASRARVQATPATPTAGQQ